MSTIKYPTNAVSMVPVLEILQRVTESIDFRKQRFSDVYDTHGYTTNYEMWSKWLRAKSSDLGFWELVDKIQQDGFKVPVAIHITRNSPGVPDTWTMGNGHHRVAAALLLVLDKIPVYFTDDIGAWIYETSPNGAELMYNDQPAALKEMSRLLWA